jgi:hypothetical protein
MGFKLNFGADAVVHVSESEGSVYVHVGGEPILRIDGATNRIDILGFCGEEECSPLQITKDGYPVVFQDGFQLVPGKKAK